ncbi:13794_t:CDS:2 [Ambispora leptoticha]|uniref:13794_t:CDS:1 n=1 Tax=Ambispora leptoticha TaxID=144679 RepID=A0A9N9GLP7_9GLOM|nr:13794_t:CDS:2 [Ambispora leptoticha]
MKIFLLLVGEKYTKKKDIYNDFAGRASKSTAVARGFKKKDIL